MRDTIRVPNTDIFSRMKSVMAQTSHQIEEKKRLAREEKARKRAEKNKGVEEKETTDGE